MELQKINVSIAEFKVVNTPAVLETQSLGSCIGVIMYDPLTKVAGLAHIMLPNSKKAPVGNKSAKYADIALIEMLAQMEAFRAARATINARIAGGACMFSGSAISDFMNIGARNVEAAKLILNELKIPIIAEDTGGKHGRTVEFNTTTGKVFIKSAMHPTKEL